MQKLCCVRTRQHSLPVGLFHHKLTTISQPILNHFRWELYHSFLMVQSDSEQGSLTSHPRKDQEYDWTRSVYSGACEQIPHDIPKPLRKHVQTTHYVDDNLHHDLATGKAVTAVLHFLNQTPIDAYTKRQSTVETATYGSEFVAARTAVDQIIDIRTTLRYLGVPIRDKSYMLGDNRSVDTSSTIPNSTISRRHHLASYHRVREAIAAKYISFQSNPADILSKHWEFATVWPMLKPILFWRGETATQLKGSDRIP